MINAADYRNSKFLADLPPEIGEIMEWYAGSREPGACSASAQSYAGTFLGALKSDRALIPAMEVSSGELLARILLHHETNPGNPAAWLNLGLALRRVALHHPEHSPGTNEKRLRLALESLERSRQFASGNEPLIARAFCGEAMTYHQLGLFEDEVKCCRQALAIDRSDLHTWSLYLFALRSAGRDKEALGAAEEAYKAYVTAGEPEELRSIFADIVADKPSTDDLGSTVH